MSKAEHIDTLCKALWEMLNQAPHDLCGEQREFYLSRMRDSFVAATTLFPQQMTRVVAADEPDE